MEKMSLKKSLKKISCSIFREGLREYIFANETKQRLVIDIEIKHTIIQQSQFVCRDNRFHRSCLLSLCRPSDSQQAPYGSYQKLTP